MTRSILCLSQSVIWLCCLWGFSTSWWNMLALAPWSLLSGAVIGCLVCVGWPNVWRRCVCLASARTPWHVPNPWLHYLRIGWVQQCLLQWRVLIMQGRCTAVILLERNIGYFSLHVAWCVLCTSSWLMVSQPMTRFLPFGAWLPAEVCQRRFTLTMPKGLWRPLRRSSVILVILPQNGNSLLPSPPGGEGGGKGWSDPSKLL